jgi:hypothetical protein
MEEIKGCDVNYIITYHLEIAKICNIFENSKKRFNAIFESANELRLKDVLRKMPKVIHISCHGLNPSGAAGYALRFEEKGKRQDIYEKQLDELLGKFEDQLKCIDLVFLSSCHSEVAGKLFKKHGAKNVIYIDKNWPVSNTASLDFAISFYQNLVNCKSVRDSFEATKKELDEKEKINYKNNIKCCCNSHSIHRKDTCLLSDPKKREEIHKEFHEKICECKNNEFCMHEDNCTLLNAVKKFNRNKKNKNGKKRALVLITHLIEEANLISDTIGILHNKKIKEPGKVGDFIKKEANEIILSIEFYKPSNNSLKEKYGDILSQTVKNSEDINNLLSRINRGKYANLMTKDKFGRPIFKGIEKRGYSKSIGILRLVKYLDNISLLSTKIKEYFNSMYCIDFSLNNFIFKVTKVKGSDKCPSRICGILEKIRDQCNLSEYTYEFNTLGKIFLNYTKEEEDKIDIADSSNKENMYKFNITL